jgi:signal transduction histidine kinase
MNNSMVKKFEIPNMIDSDKSREDLLLEISKSNEKILTLKEQLRQNQGRLNQAQYMVKIGIWDWDIRTDETQWFGEMFNIYGIKKDEFTGKGNDYINFTHPDDRQIQISNIEKDFEKAVSLAEYTGDLSRIQPDPKEFRIIRPDGGICWVRGDAVAIVDDDGQPYRMLGVLTDISKQKLLEAELIQSQKMEALGTMAGGIAHEFNNVLMAIQGFVDLSLMNLQNPILVDNYLIQIKNSTQLASEIIKQILLFSKRGINNLSVINPRKSIIQMLKLVKLTCPPKIKINSNIEADLGNIKSNSGQIQQIGTNLITNSIQAINNKDSGIINITAVKKECKNCEYKNKDHHHFFQSCFQFIVEDNGPGIKPEYVEKIFDPFFTTKEHGTGLGLSVVKGIVDNQKGHIFVDTEINIGTTVAICIPNTEESIISKQSDEEVIISANKTPKKILLVEDQDILLDLYKTFLSREGLDVIPCLDGQIALNEFNKQEEMIDLIITDIQMPKMTGTELISEIRKKSKIPIIIISGSVSGDNSVLDIENTIFLQKPFDLKSFKNKILLILNKVE